MEKLNFETAFKYPFNRPVGMLNILWVLIPIFGWFLLMGYGIRITKEFMVGKFKELPKVDPMEDFFFGFTMFVKMLPFIIVYGTILISLSLINENLGSVVNFLLGLLGLPMLIMNFFKKETIESSFDFKVFKPVFENYVEYLKALLFSILLGIVWVFLMLVLVGIPANAFTKNMYMADFYRRFVK